MRDIPPEADFIQAVLTLQLLAEQRIKYCQRLQERYRKQGQAVPLYKVLLEKHYLTPKQIETIRNYCEDTQSRLKNVPAEEPRQQKKTEEVRDFSSPSLCDLLGVDPPIANEPLTPSSAPVDNQSLELRNTMKGTFGRYQILGELGRGGMGVVYRAYDPTLQRHVALKVIQHVGDAGEQKRFDREACLMARLNHPHIIKIFDTGQAGKYSFFTMELIEGGNLSELLQESVPGSQLLRILMEVARAVHYAHGQGVIHRDLKPSNIMLDKNGEPRVMDFGLAKEMRSSQVLSKSHEILGTLEYMSPEQANGKLKEIDARSDVYSLGIILYQILTAKSPFTGLNPMNMLYQIMFSDPVPPSRFHRSLSKDLEAICLKAIEKEKARRYQSALDLGEDIGRYLAGKPVQAKPITFWVQAGKWGRRHRIVAMLSSVLFLLVVAGVVGFILYQQQVVTAQKKLTRLAEIQKTEALEQKDIAKTNEATAKLEKIKAQLSNAQAELVLAKREIENCNFVAAMERKENAKSILNLDTIEYKKNEELLKSEKITYEQLQLLKNTVRQMERYCILPNVHQRRFITRPELAEGDKYGPLFIPQNTQLSWRWLVFYADDNGIAVRDWAQKRDVWLPGANLYKIDSLAFSPDNLWVAWGDQEGNLTVASLVNLDKREQRKIGEIIDGKVQGVQSLRFSPDSKLLFSATQSRYMLWEVATMTVIWEESAWTDGICAFSPDTKWLAVGHPQPLSPQLNLYDLEKIHNRDVAASYSIDKHCNSLCFGPHPDAPTLLIGQSNDILVYPQSRWMAHGSEVKKQKGKEEEVITLLRAHQGKIRTLSISPDGHFFASVGEDGKCKFWSVYNYQKVFEIPLPELGGQICFDPDAKNIGIWEPGGISLYTWESQLTQSLDPLRREGFSKDLKPIIKELSRSNIGRNYTTRHYGPHVTFSRCGQYLVYYLGDICLWDLHQDRLTLLREFGNLVVTQGVIQSITFNPTGSLLLVVGKKLTEIWNVENGERMVSQPTAQAFSTLCWASANLLLNVSPPERGKREVKLWKIENSRLTLHQKISTTLRANSEKRGVKFMHFDPLSRKMACYTYDDWTLETWIVEFDSENFQDLATSQLTSWQASDSRFEHLETCCFGDSSLVLGTTSGIFYNWLQNKESKKISVYDAIQQIYYDPTEKLYWIITERSLFIYPHLDDSYYLDRSYRPLRELVDQIYPLQLYAGYPIKAVDISREFNRLAMAIQSGEVLVFNLR